MSLTKVNYQDDITLITAQNLNDIQDAIIALENDDGSGALPAYSAADDGKFLRISGSEIVWASVPSAEGQVF